VSDCYGDYSKYMHSQIKWNCCRYLTGTAYSGLLTTEQCITAAPASVSVGGSISITYSCPNTQDTMHSGHCKPATISTNSTNNDVLAFSWLVNNDVISAGE